MIGEAFNRDSSAPPRLTVHWSVTEHAQKRFLIYGHVRRALGLAGAGDPSGC